MAWAPATLAAETVIAVRAEGPPTTGRPSEASLQAALVAARSLRTAAGSPAARDAIVIELAPGLHRLTDPIEVTEADSGTAAAPLIIRARAGGTATLTGGVTLKRLPADAGLLANYPAVARPHLAFYELPEVARKEPLALVARRYDNRTAAVPFEVFDAKGPLRPARWPNEGWARGRSTKASGTGLLFADNGAWKGEAGSDVWVSGFLRHDWAFEAVRLARRDVRAGSLTLANAPVFGFADSFRFAVHHARSDLDEAGEWHRDESSRTLALWPREGGGPPMASVASRLLLLKGARHVRIERLVLEQARGDAIFVQGGSHIEITGVTVRNVGGWGIAFEGPSDSTVTASSITDVGEGGVILSGGDRANLASARLRLSDTVIERFGRLGLTHRPAVSLHGVGNTARGNYIADGPHTAIDFTGNDHVIELNEITRVVRQSGDAGAIYTGRDWTAQGTLIKHNFLHDIRAGQGREVKGVYLDDLASGIKIEGNVFLRVDQPVFIGGGRDNQVANNLFIASDPGIHIDGRGLTWAKDMATRRDGQLMQRLSAMPVTSPLWRQRYPRLATTLADEPAKPKRNIATQNVFTAGTPYRLLPEVDAKLQQLEAAAAGTELPPTLARQLAAATRPSELQVLPAARPKSWPLLPFEQMDRRLLLGDGAPR
ncbi:MAG: right-handed parallel beta-helix repeat-containing protein [Hyphomicrobiaceae bacterium]